MTDHTNPTVGEFSVWQQLKDGGYAWARRFVDAKTAVEVATFLSTSVGARLGTTERVFICDGGDSITWEWKREEGITFPPDFAGLGLFKEGLDNRDQIRAQQQGAPT